MSGTINDHQKNLKKLRMIKNNMRIDRFENDIRQEDDYKN